VETAAAGNHSVLQVRSVRPNKKSGRRKLLMRARQLPAEISSDYLCVPNMKRSNCDLEDVWQEIQYRHERGELPQWRYSLARAIRRLVERCWWAIGMDR
jgi:hypothetical protein